MVAFSWLLYRVKYLYQFDLTNEYTILQLNSCRFYNKYSSRKLRYFRKKYYIDSLFYFTMSFH